ncbi:hypothetical protein BKA82DRAFT_14171 [Pisolithus tinctorius]|uniref:Uncharacterized protein n=1 Tax=Pisolithus tinctorius Marx 270 TaxID=870435 RepID=A0A0C3P8F4_PISTI|nr:hypothetical protein BKA82DRAFT_14171 [Pisolithus tinctorius]KIO09745.1 hypothetical protein M404DRAFT_14171 [Pisolithus tinctorius Marx 270]
MQAEQSTSASPPTGQSSIWHAIRPWTPHLTLAVREITSVSVTFILSSVLDTRVSAANATDGAEAEQTLDQVSSSTSGSTSVVTATSSTAVSPGDSHRPVLADVLTQELSVDVNGSSWKHFILHMPDAADEAIVLIYGLHPGRQYDIDIALVGGGVVGRRMVVTSDATESGGVGERSEENKTTFAPSPAPSSPVSHSPSPSTTPTPTTLAQTHEDRLRTLSSTLSALNEEQATLQSLLKSTRRDAQKTSATLRNEVDILRRASEKAIVAEGKARQRVRALEDAVKKANEGREEIEWEIEQNESATPAVREREAKAEEELKRVKAEADGVRLEREKKEEGERRRKESMRAESVSLTQRTERLNVKRERLEGSIIPDLEAQLAEIERKIELVEMGGRQHQADESWDGDTKGKSQRRKSHPGTIGRSRSNTTQKPAPTTQVNSPPIQLPRHLPRSQSTYHKGLDGGLPGLASPPGFSFQSGLKHTPISSTHTTSAVPVSSGLGQSGNLVFSTSSSMASSLARSTGSAVPSTLSSKAPPFEPTRNLPNKYQFGTNGSMTNLNAGTFVASPTSLVFSSSPSGGGTLPTPIQRPTHTSGSTSSSGSQNPASVTAQLLRLGRPAPVTLPKTANGENKARTSSSG